MVEEEIVVLMVAVSCFPLYPQWFTHIFCCIVYLIRTHTQITRRNGGFLAFSSVHQSYTQNTHTHTQNTSVRTVLRGIPRTHTLYAYADYYVPIDTIVCP